jgi:hypothetical protein
MAERLLDRRHGIYSRDDLEPIFLSYTPSIMLWSGRLFLNLGIECAGSR